MRSHSLLLSESERRTLVRALDAYRHEVSHPSGPIPADDDDYVNASLVVERLANMARVPADEEQHGQ